MLMNKEITVKVTGKDKEVLILSLPEESYKQLLTFDKLKIRRESTGQDYYIEIDKVEVLDQ
ncbi:portal protein [Bacillus phage BCPST]|uniref:Portal protein n=1 Tax=Bacillus phage BCPST TaxID=2801506 RepID=A0AAE7TQX2_9CAUD|nr:portal protein [Bacillus phage BCPST]QQO38728.1 portal protein [Bacillus phage BCPST]